MAETPVEQFDREVAHNFRWNFAVNILDVSFITFGLSLISRETVMPLLISKLTDSTIAIGLLPAIYTLGIFLPQLVGAGMTALGVVGDLVEKAVKKAGEVNEEYQLSGKALDALKTSVEKAQVAAKDAQSQI